MKRLFITLSILCLVSSTILGQHSYKLSQFTGIDSLPSEKRAAKKFNNHMSPGALNMYFNNQMSRYLSGKEDLTMNRTYAIFNNSDGEMTFGYTIAKAKSKKDYVPFLAQFGVRIKSGEGFAELINLSDNTLGSIGLFFKGTFLSNGRLTFGHSNVQIQNEKSDSKILTLQNYERYLSEKYKTDIDKEITEIQQDVELYGDEFNLTEVEKKTIFNKRRRDLQEKKELEYLEEVENYLVKEKLFIASHKSWVSFDGFFAVKPSEYTTTPDFTTVAFDTLKLRPHSVNISGNYLYAHRSGLTAFFSFGPSIEWQNTITRDGIEKTSFLKYIERDDSNTEIELTETSDHEVYVGDFDRLIITPSINTDLTVMLPKKLKFMGLSFALEYRMSTDDIWFWKWGIPFNLIGKDDDTKVNIEPQVRWDSKNKEALVGLSVGLPFGKSLFDK